MSTITVTSMSTTNTEELLAFLQSDVILDTPHLARGLFLLIKAQMDFKEWRLFALTQHRSPKETVFVDCLELLRFPKESKCEIFCNEHRNTQEQGFITLYIIAFSNFIKDQDPKKGGENGGAWFSEKSVSTTLNTLRKGKTYKGFIGSLCRELQTLLDEKVQEEPAFLQEIKKILEILNSSIPFELASDSTGSISQN